MKVGDAVLSVYRLAGEKHNLWVLSNFLEALYPTSKPSKRQDKFQAIVEEVRRVHKRLWPEREAPKVEHLEPPGESGFVNVMRTSLMFSAILWGWLGSKRSPESKQVRANLLAAAVKLACKTGTGMFIDFPAINPDGTCEQQRSQVVGSSLILDCWTKSMSQAVALHWDRELNDNNLPIPSSTRSATLLSDYVLWVLKPIPVNYKDVILRGCKKNLENSALQIMTYIAKHYEVTLVPELFRQQNDPDIDRPFAVPASRGAKRKRLNSVVVNSVAAKAAQKLLLGKAFVLLSRHVDFD